MASAKENEVREYEIIYPMDCTKEKPGNPESLVTIISKTNKVTSFFFMAGFDGASSVSFENTADDAAYLLDICRVLVKCGAYSFAEIFHFHPRFKNGFQKAVHYSCDGQELDIFKECHSCTGCHDACPIGFTHRTGLPYLDRDLSNLLAASAWQKAADEEGLNMVISVPLLHDEECIGALVLWSKRPKPPGDKQCYFEKTELQILVGAAKELSIGSRLESYSLTQFRDHPTLPVMLPTQDNSGDCLLLQDPEPYPILSKAT